MDILFLDANVLFSAAYQKQNGLLKLWQLPKTKLISSSYAFEEALRNLNEPEQKTRLQHLIQAVTVVAEAPTELLPEITLAAKDRPILSAAIGAKANYLLTGDFKDFGPYFGKRVAGVMILPPGQFFQI